jgi:hypothetical protein
LNNVRSEDVALWSVQPDGAKPQVLEDDLGACVCLRVRFTPKLHWAPDGATITVSVPNGSKGEWFTVRNFA